MADAWNEGTWGQGFWGQQSSVTVSLTGVIDNSIFRHRVSCS